MKFRISCSLVLSVSALLIILKFRVSAVDDPLHIYFLTDWGLFILSAALLGGLINYAKLFGHSRNWLLQGLVLGASLGGSILALRYFVLVLLVYLDVVQPLDGKVDSLLQFAFLLVVLTVGDLFQEGGIFVLLAMFNMSWLLALSYREASSES